MQTAHLLSLDEALARLLAVVQPLLASESVATMDADGCVLAQDVVSPLDVPGFDNSQMDGYALRAADVAEAGAVLPVSQRIQAGQLPQALAPHSAARIFTGAPMPPGADSVVMQEACETVEIGAIRIQVVPQAGQWVRRLGEDVRAGQVALQRGTRLTPAAVGLMASLGQAQVQVSRAPRVALFSTGDELVMPGEVLPKDLKPGAIYNSNRFVLRALLKRAGCIVSDLGIVPDQRQATIEALRAAAADHDLVLTSGGVSVGEEDHVKPAVRALGELDVWSISMKPGKPFAFGRIWRGPNSGGANSAARDAAYVVGLPGNPVSSLVTFLLLVWPMLARLQGQSGDLAVRQALLLRADFTRSKADSRREFVRARTNSTGGLDLFPNQNSSVLTSAVWAEGLVDLAPGQTVSAGDLVRFLPFSSWLQ